MMNAASLIEARLNAGHSIRSLARELELNEQTIRRLESGKPVHPASAKKIADFFEVKVTDLPSMGDEVAAA